ncbi:MAG: hypothetical protein U0936_04850 [Planctomycetaceae bacterium]
MPTTISNETIKPPRCRMAWPNCRDRVKISGTSFGLDTLLLRAAAEEIEITQANVALNNALEVWAQSLSVLQLKTLSNRFLIGDSQDIKAEMPAKVRATPPSISWPATWKKQTLSPLLEICNVLRSEETRIRKQETDAKANRTAAKAETERLARPDGCVASHVAEQSRKMMESRGTDNDKAAADILTDLLEAIAGRRRYQTRLPSGDTARKEISDAQSPDVRVT